MTNIYVKCDRDLALKSATYVDFTEDNPSGFVGRLWLSYIEEWILTNRSNLKGKCEYEPLRWDPVSRGVRPSRMRFEHPEDAVLFRIWLPTDSDSLPDLKNYNYQI